MFKKNKKKPSNGCHIIVIHGSQAEDVICVERILRGHMCTLKTIRLVTNLYPHEKSETYWEIRYFATSSRVEKINNELSRTGIKVKTLP